MLGHSRFTLEDNFFEVGGHSLLLAKLQKGLQSSLGVQIPILSLLQHTSVSSQASLAAGLSSTPDAVCSSMPLPSSPARDLGSARPDIAIIGMSGRFPGAEGVSEFWIKICQATECITHFSDEELLKAGANPEDLENPAFVRARGTLENPELFDAAFFGFTPRDAELTDPQHRLFLECAWETFESAGYVPDSIQGRVGVYAGSSLNTYFLAHVLQNQQSISEFTRSFQVDRYPVLVGNDKDYLATRVAYKFDLRGPAITIQTACSTSLVAVVQACGALQSQQCDVALAGGVSISFPQQRGYIYEEGAIASSEGRCRAFDARATGTVFGAGVGAVLLKRLPDALRDRDPIVAVIKGVGINNDGRDKASFSAPSIAGQTEVIRTALAQAGVSPDGIGYVEAHGTGTPLGDPIEVQALSQAFRHSTQRSQFCALGAVKTNIGHLESAAGVTGLIKAALAVKHGLIPPTLHFTRPNPLCELEKSPFYVPTELMPWPPGMVPRRAGVSSFGVGGTNAHVILEQAPVEIPAPAGRSPQLLTISARSQSALLAASARLAAFLQQRLDSNSAGHLRLDDIAYTLQTGRRAFRQRRHITAFSLEEAVEKLNAPLRLDGSSPVAEERPPEVVFLFPGQGGQYVGMGADLYENEPIFRQAVDRCAALLPGALWAELRVILLAKDEVLQEGSTNSLSATRLTQPAVFIIEYALAQLWISWGIRPAAVIGHSVGEFVAAVLVDSFTLADALNLVVERARLMQSLPEGAMLAVRRGAEAIAPLLPPESCIAAYNSPSLCTVSGPALVLQAFAELLQTRRVACKHLDASHAFHSSMMDPIVKPFTELVRSVKHRSPALPWISTCTGGWMTAADLDDPAYWARQLRQPVQFQEAIGLAFKTKYRVFVEVGPGEALTTFARQHPAKPPNLLGVSAMVQGSGEAQESFHRMQALGALWTAGCAPNWEALQGGKLRHRVSLPTYPFERQRYWIEPTPVLTKERASSPRSADESPSPPSLESPRHSPPPAMQISTTPANPPAARAEHLARLIRELIFEVSGTTVTDDTVSFLELGLDSLFLTQAGHALRTKFGIKITFRQLLESSSSVQELAAYLDQRLPPEAFRPQAATIPEAAPPPVSPSLDDSSAAMALGLSQTEGDTGKSRLNRAQQVYLSQFIDRYTRRTAKSKALTQQYRRWYADPRTASSFKRLWKEMVYQIVVSRSAGAYLWDIDGNRYIDLLNGFGPNFLGHSSQLINDALKAQIDRGIEVGPQSPLAGETAKMFCELTGNERASFVNTGSEAVYAAMRLARAVTGKDKIVIFAKDYHGNFDEVLARAAGSAAHPLTMPVAAGIPKRAVQDMIVLEYGSPAALSIISARADEIAAVMVEPVQSRRPELQPFQFNRDLRRLTQQKGIALIFDEVITGVRHRPDGAQGLYGVEADIATYGKVVGGGMPIGIVAGKAEYMDVFDGGFWQYGDDSFPEKGATFFAGTFVRHPLAIAATHAMLKYLLQQPPEFWDTINGRTTRLASSVDSFFVQHDIPIRMPHCCSQMFVRVPEDLELGNLLFYQLRHRGVFILENFPTYMTAAHTDQDVDQIIQAFKDSAYELLEAGFLEGASDKFERG
ncbi:MAG: aminotransferase class III-fold pyridoxal phosphate-dependent enzyme [Verrucomicrobiales bacterium]|nr:aminotransferase class III-fold pyridoxal phosphate-dependent enzyme [Verrucomicrobiales bacterium]